MALALLLALQAAAAAPPPPPMALIDFDLAELRPIEAAPCTSPDGEVIIVCARRGPVDRFTPEEMEELARLYADKPVRAETDIGGGGTAGLIFSPTITPGGDPSNRAMVTVSLPF